ncbi:MAG: FeoB-associated Cys-rich membrane protein [Candidatus Limisoma sp.]
MASELIQYIIIAVIFVALIAFIIWRTLKKRGDKGCSCCDKDCKFRNLRVK